MKQEKDIISFELTDSNDSFNVYPSSRWELELLSRIMIHLACNFTIYNLLVPLKSIFLNTFHKFINACNKSQDDFEKQEIERLNKKKHEYSLMLFF